MSAEREPSFHTILVIGVGLIGGSLAAAAKRLDPAPRILGVGRNVAALQEAVERGIVDEFATEQTAFDRGWFGPHSPAGLAVIGTPPAIAEEWIDRLASAGFPDIVTDVASTKSGVTKAAEKHPNLRFVGGHPMAGSERSGVGAARADLFDGANYVLTPDEGTDMDAYRRLHAFVTALGARVVSIDADEHDRAVAAISHVPHVTAAGLVSLAAQRAESGQDALRLAAGGFKDMTRIAAGSADLWTGICLDNADAICAGLGELSGLLTGFSGALRAGDRPAVHDWLEHAVMIRQSLPAQWLPKTEALMELSVPVVDRPGMVADVTTAVSRAGCNIEALSIDHTSEDTAMLRLVLTDEGDIAALLGDLESRGYEASAQPLRGEG